MNGIIKFVLKNKLAVWLLTFIIAGAGLYAGTRMKLETIPDITVPVVTVMTVYPGATPEQVMDDVSEPIEKSISSLKGVKNVHSSSYANMSSVQVEYRYGTDMEDAEREVKSIVEGLTMPETVEKPTVARITMNAFPIVALSVSSDQEDIAQLTNTVESIVKPQFDKIDGVSSASISGQHINEITLKYHEDKMASLQVTEDTVKQMIQAMDVRAPLGLFPFEDKEQSVVVDGKLTSVEQLKELQIPVTPNADNPLPFVKLGDLADIKEIGKVESVSRTNGKNAIAIQIVKGQEANTVDVVNDVKAVAKDIEKKHSDLTLDITLDQGEPIEKSIETMFSKALFGAAFAVLIILLFLRDWRSTIISIISIPLSILIAFVILNQMDITLNMMTLGAMTVAIGRVIDDSIVVVENIYRRIHLKNEPLKGRALIRAATIEMFRPIMSSTLVTVAVFAPLVFVGGMVGELFMPFALTMTFALGASLLVAITIVPALSHTLFKKQMLGTAKKPAKHKEHGKLAHGYRNILNWTLNHKLITTMASIAVLVASLFLIPKIGFSFLPEDDQKVMYLTYTPEAGELREDTLKNVAVVEEKMMANKDVKTVQMSIGGNDNAMMGGGADGSLMFIIFDADTKDFTNKKEKLTKEVTSLKQSGTWKSQDFGMTGSTNEVSYTVYGETIEDLEKVTKELQDKMVASKEIKDAKTSLSDRFDEYTLQIDREKVEQNGLTTIQVAMLLNPNTPTEKLTTLQKDGKDVNVIVEKTKEAPKNFDAVLETDIPTPLGKTIKVKDVVTVQEGSAANKIDRQSSRLFATVSATVQGDDVTKATSEINKIVDKLDVPKGVEIETGGVAADMVEAFTQLALAMVAAIAIVYFILVVTFGEGLAPFAILFSLPFTVIGTLVALFIAGETISVSVLMGLLMLIGIVVTNAIVLVDRIIHMEHDGKPMREAILEAGMTRLRPILMTAIATIGALIPLAIGAEGSGLISKGLGITVIGGLISSTILTLVIVPVVYEFISKLLKKNRLQTEE
ncbi:swarming motility protein SwrC [Lysinibacillus alkalisoli]|uniref:Swarming motility protein SwrC n=1 Tax=Lysinibacillus alkalisoli TaxID=1911548 RepID=A0A917G3G9_9BACI|nr:efflux RND transporter permease subunit [Lysinibacillus alkalisoli]GGG20654.1 swarming motility protein SwrC [Lysinibacillus alkalisoli]